MVTVSYLVHYEILLQNATEIITKCDKSLLQNALGILFQNATVLLQNVTVVTKCVDFITNCKLLQNATFITKCVDTHIWGDGCISDTTSFLYFIFLLFLKYKH